MTGVRERERAVRQRAESARWADRLALVTALQQDGRFAEARAILQEAHTDDPELDYIELYNYSTQAVNLAGCILTDDPTTNRFVLPNVTIPARGFLVYNQSELGFSLSAAGETIYLKNPAATRVLDVLRFEGQENGVATGRYPDGADRGLGDSD